MKTLHKVVAVASLLAITAGSVAYAATAITPTGSPADVTVTASVAPYLTLSLSSTGVDMGVLSTAGTTVATNATTVTADSNGTDYAVSYTINGINAALTSDVLAITGNPGNASAAQIGFSLASNGAGAAGAKVIDITSFKATPTAAQITYTAQTAAGHQAGAYGATVSYTATGNF